MSEITELLDLNGEFGADPALRAQLADLCDHQPMIAAAPLCLIFLADCRRWPRAYRAAGAAPRDPGPGDLLLAAADAVIAAQNAVTAAESLGIGSCYIGDVIEQCEAMRQALALPPAVVPAAMVVFGRPTDQQKARRKPARLPAEYVVCENTYADRTPEEHRAALTARAAADEKPAFDFDAWVRAFAARKYESGFSREMSRSVGVYLGEFFGETP